MFNIQPDPALKKPDGCAGAHAGASHLDDLRRVLLAEAAVTDIAETFKVLGDPTRVRLLDALLTRDLCVCDLARLLGLTESAVSHQLRLLRHHRVVRARRAGRQVFYALDDDHIAMLFRQARGHVQETSAVGSDLAS
jgi:ArsR family transcriptional regulator, lead/cadmium/zinc/bismuth-responsive transcriptional repressor